MPLENFTCGNIVFDTEHLVHAGKTFIFFILNQAYILKYF